MTHFLKQGSSYLVASDEAMDLHHLLPAATFRVEYNEMTGQFYLELVDDLTVSGKLYGDTARDTDRILTTFLAREPSTGVLLSGRKGSGKTLLARNLSVEARALGMPTILINKPWHGDKFNGFMQTIEQATVVIFDEFEKVYDSSQQQGMLTLLDGVYTSKKLFVLTCNDKWRIDENMNNRPGRLFYRIEFSGLDAAFIREYCEDQLDATEHTEQIVRLSGVFSDFNFDILKALIEEMNRYGETPQQATRLLNAKPTADERARYSVAVKVRGQVVNHKRHDRTWHGNPLTGNVELYLRSNDGEYVSEAPVMLAAVGGAEGPNEGDPFGVLFDAAHADGEGDRLLSFTPADIVSISDGVLTFFRDEVEVTLTRTATPQVDVWRMV